MADSAVDSLGALPLPRRAAIAQLLGEMLATERELAALYAGFAARSTLGPLTAGLAELTQAKKAHVAALEPLARVLDPRSPSGPAMGSPGAGDAAAGHGGAEFLRAFRGERALEVGYRELAALLGDPAHFPHVSQLAADAAHHRARLRALYLRYS